MRGEDRPAGELFAYVGIEARLRLDHPLRTIKVLVNEALEDLSVDFQSIGADGWGRPSIPPEHLLRAMLLQTFYSVRSERQLMERLEFDSLFRWFAGLPADEPAWDASTFSKNRDRLLAGQIAAKFFAAVINNRRVRHLLSTQHFSVDGTLIEAWAGMKSFQLKNKNPRGPGGNVAGAFRGEAVERHACINNRSRGAPLPKRQRQAGTTLLHGSHLDGEPQWPRRCHPSDAGKRNGRAGSSPWHDR